MSDNTNLRGDFFHWKRRIALFLAAQSISLFGSAQVQFAIVWYITLTTKSGVMVTMASLFAFLPQLFISFFAGAWADRWNRKFLAVTGDAIIAFFTLLLIVLLYMGYESVWLLLGISAIRSVGDGIQRPAANALIPQIVPSEHIMRVNGINSSIQSLINILSPAVAGALLVYFQMTAIFFVDVYTAAAGILITLCLRIPHHISKEDRMKRAAENTNKNRFLAEIKEGISFAGKTKWIRHLLVYYSLLLFFIVPAVCMSILFITTIFIKDTDADKWMLTANEVVFGFGMIVGGGLISLFGGFKNHVKTLAVSALTLGAAILCEGISMNFMFYLVTIFISGISIACLNAPSIVILQERVPTDFQGRIFSLTNAIYSASIPAGMIVFGPLADWKGQMGLRLIMSGSGFMIAALSFIIWFDKTMMKVGEKSTAPAKDGSETPPVIEGNGA